MELLVADAVLKLVAYNPYPVLVVHTLLTSTGHEECCLHCIVISSSWNQLLLANETIQLSSTTESLSTAAWHAYAERDAALLCTVKSSDDADIVLI